MRQAEEYRETGDLADQVFKVLNVLSLTHPEPVIRAAQMRNWFESGAYERIMAGDYRRRGEPEPAYTDDVAAAAASYRESARDTFANAQQAASGWWIRSGRDSGRGRTARRKPRTAAMRRSGPLAELHGCGWLRAAPPPLAEAAPPPPGEV